MAKSPQPKKRPTSIKRHVARQPFISKLKEAGKFAGSSNVRPKKFKRAK